MIRLDSDAKRVKSLQLVVDRVNQEYMQTILRRFGQELEKKKLDIDSIYKDYGLILATNDRDIIDKAFKLIYQAILDSNDRFKLSIMLDGGVKKYAKTPEQRILSYYLSLVALILDSKFEDTYKETLDAFQKEVANYKDVPLKKALSKFGPTLSDLALDSEKPERYKLKKMLIKKVWAKIPD